MKHGIVQMRYTEVMTAQRTLALGPAVLAVLAALLALPHAVGRGDVDPTPPPVADDAFDALNARYTASVDEWQLEYDAAEDISARRALRDRHPAMQFWAPFEELSRIDGRAALWQIEFAGRAGFPGRKGREVKAAAYARAMAIEGALDEPWMVELLTGLPKNRRAVGDEAFVAYLERAATDTTLPQTRAVALFVHGEWLVRSKADGDRERGLALLRKAAEIPDTEAGDAAGDLLYELENLAIGAIAPDFVSATADGGEFRLSDQRGKIVVLDFFGFW